MSAKTDYPETSNQHENAGRRRLVRGAVSIAPVVLTLRSGALAAASCTGAKVLTTLDSTKKVPTSVTLATDASGVVTDKCVATSNVPICDGASTVPGLPTRVKNPVGSSTIYDINNRKCLSGTTPLPAGTQVAILSSASATSLIR